MTERDENGRFAKGHTPYHNGGRKPKATEERFLERLIARVEAQDFEKMTDSLIARAKAGDAGMAKLLLGYLIGLPIQRQEISGPEGGPVEVNHHVDNDELAEALAILGRTNGCRCG